MLIQIHSSIHNNHVFSVLKNIVCLIEFNCTYSTYTKSSMDTVFYLVCDRTSFCSVVLVCDRISTIHYNYVLQGYSESLVSLSFFIKVILKD